MLQNSSLRFYQLSECGIVNFHLIIKHIGFSVSISAEYYVLSPGKPLRKYKLPSCVLVTGLPRVEGVKTVKDTIYEASANCCIWDAR